MRPEDVARLLGALPDFGPEAASRLVEGLDPDDPGALSVEYDRLTAYGMGVNRVAEAFHALVDRSLVEAEQAAPSDDAAVPLGHPVSRHHWAILRARAEALRAILSPLAGA